MLSIAALSMAALIVSMVPARAVDTDALRRKEQMQVRARAMARELVSGILDLQLQQMEENGLVKSAIYGEVLSMRKNIDALVEAEMLEVVDLLVKAQGEKGKERDATFVVARQKIREVVVRLAAERQNLLRRLKTAEIAAQVKRLIEMQTKVLKVTEGLIEQSTRQEALALRNAQDQRDVKALFLHLVETLADVSKWAGAVGAGAGDGLRILKTAGVGQELDSAGQHLDAVLYDKAAVSQKAVIRGLRLLLERIEQTQGIIGTDREALLEMVRELTKKQEAVQAKTKTNELTEKNAEKLVDEQSDVHRQLGKLSDALQSMPQTQPLVEAAKQAALEARTNLFEAKKQPAVAQQDKVLGALAEIEEQLKKAADAESSDKTAEQYEKLVKDLEKTKADVEAAKAEQAKANEAAKSNPAAAKAPEKAAADKLAKAQEGRELPRAVKSRLEEAKSAAAEAAEKAGDPAKSSEAKKQAVASADEALERAASEVNAALADAERKALGVKIGELARAAESLERAAAAERRISEATKEAAAKKGLTKKAAKDLSEEQADVGAVAKKVAEGVKNTAPEAAAKLAEAMKNTDAAAEGLKQAEAKPGEPSKPAAEKTGAEAEKAADKLSEAASKLREEVAKTASKLSETAGRQLADVSKAREAVDKAVAKQPSTAERLAQLDKAA
jgi:hypothetical protein